MVQKTDCWATISGTKMNKKAIVCLLLILLLDAGLRISALTFDSLYLDEAYQSLYESTGQPLAKLIGQHGERFRFEFDQPHPLKDLFQHFREVDPLCPPLYGVLLNRWRIVFGSSDAALRAFSVLCSVLADACLFVLALKQLGLSAAIYACLLQAISPFDVTYGQEVRMYSLELLLATISTGTFFYLLSTKRKSTRLWFLISYAVSTWGLINTHYTALFTLLFQGLFGLAACAKWKDRSSFIWILAAWAMVGLLWFPWFDLFSQAAGQRHGSYYVFRRPTWWWPFWALCGRIPLNWCAFLSGSRVPAFLAPIYVTAAALVLNGIRSTFASLKDKANIESSRPFLPLLLCWITVPALMLWSVDVLENRKVVEVGRYLIATAPAIYLVAGFGIRALSLDRKKLVALILAHCCFCLSNIVYAHIVPQRRPWKKMAALVERVIEPTDIVMVSQYYDIVCLDRYLHSPLAQIGLTPNMGKPYVTQVFASLPNLKRFWLLTAEDGDAVVQLLPSNCEKVSATTKLEHDLNLTLYKVK